MTMHTSPALPASANATARARIAVIGTGGTFAMHARHRFDWIEYADSGVIHPIDHLLTQLGELAPEVDLIPIPFRNLGSVAITPADWLALARLIRETAASDPHLQGFVITHGTATLEETAWFLDLTLNISQPVVLTGAQRPINTSGSDAPANLRAAVMVAADPAAQGTGVLAVLDRFAHVAVMAGKVAAVAALGVVADEDRLSHRDHRHDRVCGVAARGVAFVLFRRALGVRVSVLVAGVLSRLEGAGRVVLLDVHCDGKTGRP